MSSILSKSLEALKNNPRETGEAQLFKLDRPPTQPFVQHYGYEVSPAWLIQFAEHHYPEGIPDRNDKSYNSTAIRLAYDIIRDWGRMCILATNHCFNSPEACPVPTEWLATMYDDVDDPEDLQGVLVLSVCSDEEDDFEWRPVQAKMDFLTKSIGHEPKWWPSCGFAG
ncbi:hypothetical protein AZE42_03058 [Rhizopogon vesiculosus]|uniref:Uncharacterized protein n=1 Tax=Rhizopogon vesiculosus TaxID=180088 RepID=A0A1J8PPW4_9AGAM|nr:hypothetical protein AZE42_03058 [Rhizopogon vesiculosus]